MRYKRVKIDSLNLSSMHLESIFIRQSNYKIENIKTKSVFHPKVWSQNFGKPLTMNIVEAKIIHSYLGLVLPLKSYARNPHTQTIEFAGLHGYNERSELLVRAYKELESQMMDAVIVRVDIAIDYKGKISQKVIQALLKHREPFSYGNTTYYKTPKEKKTNSIMDIKIYDKQKQAKLDFSLHRLEFVFKAGYFKGIQLRNIDRALQKMQKTIKRMCGLNVKIEPIG